MLMAPLKNTKEAGDVLGGCFLKVGKRLPIFSDFMRT